MLRNSDTNDEGSPMDGLEKLPGNRIVLQYTTPGRYTIIYAQEYNWQIIHLVVPSKKCPESSLKCRWKRSTSPLAWGWYAVVRWPVVPRRCINSHQRPDSNWRPCSAVIIAETIACLIYDVNAERAPINVCEMFSYVSEHHSYTQEHQLTRIWSLNILD